MATFSTREAAKMLGLDAATLSRYITSGKIPAPKSFQVGKVRLHSWTERDVERVRAILPKIKNGRTTRHKKQAQKTQSKQKAKR
jgi:excisionase family DNA binding protein